MKSRLISMVLTVIAWGVLDFLFHGLLLSNDYTATASLWRPMAEMSVPAMYGVSLLQATVFTFIYCNLIETKTCKKGVKLGLLVGLLVGIGSGLGSYVYMPITGTIAIVWFLSSVVNFVVAGAINGKLVTKEMSK